MTKVDIPDKYRDYITIKIKSFSGKKINNVRIRWDGITVPTDNVLGALDIIDGDLCLKRWIVDEDELNAKIEVIKIESMEQLEVMMAKRLLTEE